MERNRLLPDFVLSTGDGSVRPFHEFLVDFNILTIRRVPVPSHGPATELLRRLLAENRGVENVTVRGFDIRSPDYPCETCNGPHIVFQGRDLVTICDDDGGIYRQFGVAGYDRFFVVASDQYVIDVGSIEQISRSDLKFGLDTAASRKRTAPAPSDAKGTRPRSFDSEEKPRARRAFE